MEKLSKAAGFLEMEPMFTSRRKTRRARPTLQKINLKMKKLPRAAYYWRRQMLPARKSPSQKEIGGGDWLGRFYKLSAEVRIMIWNNIIFLAKINNPQEMPDIVQAFRAEKKNILYQEVLEVHFKVTTLNIYDGNFTLPSGNILQRLKRGYSTQRFQSLNLILSKLVYPF
jgi:hypothetical protein